MKTETQLQNETDGGPAEVHQTVATGAETLTTSQGVAIADNHLLVASGRAVRTHGLRPRARIHHLSARCDDPVLMLTAPIAATAHAVRRAAGQAGQPPSALFVGPAQLQRQWRR